ncbi:Hypothetical protein SMAX5B_018315 [Scophthalmus maximus]|uniref:Uncharacterized protein n=1 Tax=Scophthalmus maximus TaxID=52904 RepID=A0A2U9CBC2_SCOMX|nr:Hypothetical protein SMAX5B_018315 [Scophthalmus maximus]
MFLQGPGTVGLGSWLSVAGTQGAEVIPEADGEQKVEATIGTFVQPVPAEVLLVTQGSVLVAPKSMFLCTTSAVTEEA